MKWLLRIVAVGIVLFVAWKIWERIFVTDEKRVKKQISVMVGAVEKGDLLRLEGAVAQDYSDDFGLDKPMLLAAARSFRQQYDAIYIHLSDLTITVEGDRQKAQAIFIAKIIAKAKGSLSESEVRADRFRLYFRKTDSGWKLIRAQSPELKFD